MRERAEAAGGVLLDGPGLEIRDPWGNRLEVVEYRRVQFTKSDAVLTSLNARPEKSREAVLEIGEKGMSASGAGSWLPLATCGPAAARTRDCRDR
jgi:hypothetical protein